MTTKYLLLRPLLPVAAALILSACAASQSPAPVVSGNSGGASSGSGVYTPGKTDNPDGGEPYTPDGGSHNGSAAGGTTGTYTDTNTPYTPSAGGGSYTPPPAVQPAQPVYTPPAHGGSTGFTPNYSPVDPNASVHRVQPGDTIYNISKRYGISQDSLRQWNNLSGDNISIGQTLRVKPAGGGRNSSGAAAYTPAANGTAATHRVAPGDTVYNIAKRYGISQDSLRRWNNLSSDNISVGQTLVVRSADGTSGSGSYTPPSERQSVIYTPPAQTADPYTPPPAPEPVPAAQPEKTTPAPASARTVRGIAWQSPLPGSRLTAPFSAATKGIELAGSPRQNVVASADGMVIFSGTGPRGYGNIVIVQHETGLVSAYSRVEALRVRQKQAVKRGQVLAAAGSDGKVHMEIRDSGKPLNPADFIRF